MLTKTLSKIVFEPKSFFQDEAAEMPPGMAFLFLAATLIIDALGFWFVARGVVNRQWNLHFDLILMGLAALAIAWLAFCLTTWIVARILGLKWRLFRLAQAVAYGATPFVLAWVPGLLRRVTDRGTPELFVKIFTVLVLAFMLNLALRLIYGAAKSGYLTPSEEPRLGRRLTLALFLPVILAAGLVIAASMLQANPDFYKASSNIIFGEVEGWERITNQDSFLTLQDSQAPEGAQKPLINVWVVPREGEVTQEAIFQQYLAIFQGAGAQLVTSEDTQVLGSAGKRAEFSNGAQNLTLVVTTGGSGDEIMVAVAGSMQADAERANARFSEVIEAMRPYSTYLHIAVPGLMDWHYYL
jgi:hypothetical protein